MHKRSIKIRLLAIFIVAFVCLNAGGGACVAYCRTTEVVETEHCPLKKTDEHCDKTGKTEPARASLDVGTGEFDCCPMTVSFFAAPIQSNTLSFTDHAAATASHPRYLQPTFIADRSIPDPVAYRGPPPLDARVLRLQHCIIRI